MPLLRDEPPCSGLVEPPFFDGLSEIEARGRKLIRVKFHFQAAIQDRDGEIWVDPRCNYMTVKFTHFRRPWPEAKLVGDFVNEVLEASDCAGSLLPHAH